MKRLFGPKEANVITPLPLKNASERDNSFVQRDYLPPSPSPLPTGFDFRPGYGAQPGLPPTASTSSSTHSQRHSSYQPLRSPPHKASQQQHQQHHTNIHHHPEPSRGSSGRPQSFQLFDAGPQPLQQQQLPTQHRHQHHPSAPRLSPVLPPRELHSIPSGARHSQASSSSSSSRPAAASPADAARPSTQASGVYAQYHYHPAPTAAPGAYGDTDTDSDDEAAYQQSRALNNLVPRANPLGARRSDPVMDRQHSNQGSVASRSSGDRALWGSPQREQQQQHHQHPQQQPHDSGHQHAEGNEERPRRSALGMRRWRSLRKQRSDQEEGDSDGDSDGSGGIEPEAQRSSWHLGGDRFGAPVPMAYPVYAGNGEEGSEVLLSTGTAGGQDRSRNDKDRPLETEKDRDRSKGKGKGPKKLFGFGKEAKSNSAAGRSGGRTTAAEDHAYADHEDAGRRLRPDGSWVPDDNIDQHRSRDLPPTRASPLPATAAPAASSSRKDHWYDLKSKKKAGNNGKPSKDAERESEGIVIAKVGWLCAQQAAAEDWEVVLSLAEAVSHSDAASKEAARALRKEFKYGNMEAQKRAARIWAVLTMNSSDRFKLQVASKRFLDVVEGTISSSKTPLSVKETLLRVLGVLAYEFRNHSELSSVTKCWNKIKPSDRPTGGEPMDPALDEFSLGGGNTGGGSRVDDGRADGARLSGQPSAPSSQPPTRPLSYSHETQYQQQMDRQEHHQQQQHQLEQQHHSSNGLAPLDRQLNGQSNASYNSRDYKGRTPTEATATAVLSAHPNRSQQQPQPPLSLVAGRALPSWPIASHAPHASPLDDDVARITLDADIRKLHEECQIAQSNASVLVETMLAEGMRPETEALIDEFYRKAVASQESLMSQVPWASAQVDHAKAAVDQHRVAIAAAEGRPVSEVGSDDLHRHSASVATSTWQRQERLLSDLLETHGRCVETVRMVDEARRHAEADEEERRVTELSKFEVRVDRSALVEDPETGELFYNRQQQQHNDVGGFGDKESWRRGGLGGSGGRGVHLGASAQASGSRSPSPNPAPLLAGGSSSGSSSQALTGSVTSPSPSQQQAQPLAQPRASRPLPVPGSDKSSSNGHNNARLNGGHSQAHQSQSQSQGYGHSSCPSASQVSSTGSVGSNSGQGGGTAYSREASSASSTMTFASRNPYSNVDSPPAPQTAAEGGGGGPSVNPFTRPYPATADDMNAPRSIYLSDLTSSPPSPPLQARPITTINTNTAPPLPPHPIRKDEAGGAEEEEEDSILTPVVPSEKALGKRRGQC